MLINANSPQQFCPTIARPPDSLRQLLIKWHSLLRHISSPTTSAAGQTVTPQIPMSEIEMNRGTMTPKRRGTKGMQEFQFGGQKWKNDQPKERWRSFNHILMTGWMRERRSGGRKGCKTSHMGLYSCELMSAVMLKPCLSPYLHWSYMRRNRSSEVSSCASMCNFRLGLLCSGPLVPPGLICWAWMHDQYVVYAGCYWCGEKNPANSISPSFSHLELTF